MFGCARSLKVEKALVLLVHSRGILHVIFRGCQSHFFMIASMWSREGVVLAADEAAHISHQKSKNDPLRFVLGGICLYISASTCQRDLL